MSEIVFLLEEPSAEAMLDGLLPRILPDAFRWRCIVFEGKQDLERQIVKKIRNYRVPGARFVVLRDQDAADCHAVKSQLKSKCAEAGHPGALIRIACRELESWYLADLVAVERGLEVDHLSRLQMRNPYRSPDSLPSPSRRLNELVPSYQKVGGSRAIGPHLDPENARSKSFRNWVDGIRRLTRES